VSAGQEAGEAVAPAGAPLTVFRLRVARVARRRAEEEEIWDYSHPYFEPEADGRPARLEPPLAGDEWYVERELAELGLPPTAAIAGDDPPADGDHRIQIDPDRSFNVTPAAYRVLQAEGRRRAGAWAPHLAELPRAMSIFGSLGLACVGPCDGHNANRASDVPKWKSVGIDWSVFVVVADEARARAALSRITKLGRAAWGVELEKADVQEGKEEHGGHKIDALLKWANGKWFGDDQDAFNKLPDETDDAYFRRIAINPDRLDEICEQWEFCGGDLDLIERMLVPDDADTPSPSFLVEGLIPRGDVSILVAPEKTGKSTLATELAVAVASGGGAGAFCGLNIPADACKGLVILLSGEDSTATLKDRIRRMDPAGRSGKRLMIFGKDTPLAVVLTAARSAPLSLLIVDPAAKYIVGDEDAVGPVSGFFTELEGIAEAKGAAVVVLHHTRRGGPYRSLTDVAQATRGSGVFTQRPRVVLAMSRRPEFTLFGIARRDGNPLHNMTVPMMVEPITLYRDPVTLRHLTTPPADTVEHGAAVKRPGAGQPAEEAGPSLSDRVLSVIRAEGSKRPVHRTGQRSVWAYGRAEFRDATRADVERAVDELVQAGALLADSKGRLSIAPAASVEQAAE